MSDNVRQLFPPLIDVCVPEELRELPAWLCWRYEQFDGEEKPRKMPFWANGQRRHGEQGASTDRANLTTFAAARDAAIRRGYDGVGFAPLPEFGYTFLDFDKCVNADGNLPEDVAAIVGRTYCEYSPSGQGVRAVLRGDLGNRKSHKGPYGFETFSSKGFVTLTGNILPICSLIGYENHVAEVDEQTRDLAERRFGPQQYDVDPDDFMAGREPALGLPVEEMEDLLSYLDAGMGRDEWIRVGMALHHETEGDDTGFELWDEWSSSGHNYPGTEALRYQWGSLAPRAGRPSVTMRSVIHMAKQAGYNPRKVPSPEEVFAKAEEIVLDRSPFQPLTIAQLRQRPHPEWLIKGVLPRGELGVLFGASGSGKTFVALDYAFAIARGVDWRGHRTAKGRVALIAAEGGGGVRKRIEAYGQHHDFDPESVEDFFIITAAPNFLEGDDIAEVIAQLRAIGPVDAVVIDTLAQVAPGANENTSEDMGRVLANIRNLHRALNTMPLVVHHAGKDLSKGSRGWSGIKAAADVQIEVLRHEDGAREIMIEKMKDDADGKRFPFKLEIVELGVDRDGDLITSCVAVEAEARAASEAEPSRGVKRRGRIESHILEVMYTFGAEDVVSTVKLIDKAVEMLPAPEEGRRDTRRQTVTRALHNLSREKDGPLQVAGGQVIFFE